MFNEELRLHETVLEAGFAIDRNRAGRLQGDDFPSPSFAACSCAFCNSASKHGSHIPPVSPPSPCRKRWPQDGQSKSALFIAWPLELAVTSVPHWTHFSSMIRLHWMQNRIIHASPSSGMNRMTLATIIHN
jgi:hypothetical protein